MKMFASLYSEDYVTISADKESKILMVSWKGNCTSQEYRNTMEHALEIAEELNFDGWISDTSGGSAVTPEDTAWVSNQFIPKALKQINKVAVVVAEDIFRKIGSESVETELKSSIKKVAYFDTLQDAQKWIAQ